MESKQEAVGLFEAETNHGERKPGIGRKITRLTVYFFILAGFYAEFN